MLSARSLLTTAIVAVLFTMAGVFTIQEVQAQVACGDNLPACGGGLVCTGGRCNVPPPIWNAQVLGAQEIQAGSFRVQNDSIVLGSLIVGNAQTGTGDLRTNSILSRLGPGSADNIWIGDANDTLQVQGNLTVGGTFNAPITLHSLPVPTDSAGCINGRVLKLSAGVWGCGADDLGAGGQVVGGITQITAAPGSGIQVTGAGDTRDLSLITCQANQILQRNGQNQWACANLPAVGPGGIQQELDPVYGQWFNSGNPTLTALTINDATLTPTLLRITDTAQNPELQLQYGAGATDHWAMYVSQAGQELRFWRGDDRLRITPTGDITVGGNLTVGGTVTAAGINAPISLHGLTVPTDNVNCASGRVLKISADGSSWICGEDVVGAGGGGGGGITDVNTVAGSGIQVTAAGGTRTVALVNCANGEILQRNGQNQWVCAALPAPPPATAETDPVYTLWYNGGSPIFAGSPVVSGNLRVASGGGFGGYAPDPTWRVTTPTLYVGTPGQGGTIIGAGGGQNAGDITTDGTLTVGGNVRATGCFGPTLVGATVVAVNGNLNGAPAPGDGYRGIDALCNAEFAGSHQCETGEVMNSIHCGSIWTTAAKVTLQPNIPAGVFTWIANGAPSLPTPTNDCYGWTATGVVGGNQSQGIAWNFDVRGGAGFARACNLASRILCCR